MTLGFLATEASKQLSRAATNVNVTATVDPYSSDPAHWGKVMLGECLISFFQKDCWSVIKFPRLP